MRATTSSILLILILAGPAAWSLAAEAPPADGGLEREVRRLNSTLGELVDLLRRQLESSNAAVLMQRVQLMTSRMAPLGQELRAARAEQGDLQVQLDNLEVSTAAFESELENDREQGHITDEQARALREQQQSVFDLQRKQVQERLWTARQRVIDLDQLLASRRTELETWEGEIDRALGLR